MTITTQKQKGQILNLKDQKAEMVTTSLQL